MDSMKINLNSLTVLLFCCQLKSYKEVPLSLEEWVNVERILRIHGLKGPASLLAMRYEELIDILGIDEFCAYKMSQRIKTMHLFVKALYDLEANGIYVTTKYEDTYPKELNKWMKKRAPAYLFYCGDITILSEGISIAGLAELKRKDSAYTKRLVDKIIEEKKIYISNDTKGTDSIALRYALNHGGAVACFVCDHLLMKKKEYRRYLKTGQMVMLSAVDPVANFTVTNAIDRNSYVCGLAKYQIIVSSSINNGAVWFTALQNMHQHWTIPFVVHNDYVGNIRLFDMGSVPMYIKNILSDNSFDMIYDKNKKEVEEENINVDQMSIFEFLGEDNESIADDGENTL